MNFAGSLHASLIASILILGWQKLAAQADPDLPQPVDATAAESLLLNSPFTRALDLSNSLALTGIAFVEGKPVATIMNRATKESYVVSEVPNAQGWKLAETSATKDLKHTEVKIMTGAEIVTVRYGDDQLTPEARKGARPGQSNRSPGPPGSGGEPRFRSSSYLSDADRDKYRALSDGARDKFRELMRHQVESKPNAPMEEHSAFAQKEFQKIEAEDRRTRR